MRVMNPTLQQYSAEHVERAFFGTAPTLFTLRHAYHDDAATIWMLPQLYDLNEYCGCKEKLDEAQMTQLARIQVGALWPLLRSRRSASHRHRPALQLHERTRRRH